MQYSKFKDQGTKDGLAPWENNSWSELFSQLRCCCLPTTLVCSAGWVTQNAAASRGLGAFLVPHVIFLWMGHGHSVYSNQTVATLPKSIMLDQGLQLQTYPFLSANNIMNPTEKYIRKYMFQLHHHMIYLCVTFTSCINNFSWLICSFYSYGPMIHPGCCAPLSETLSVSRACWVPTSITYIPTFPLLLLLLVYFPSISLSLSLGFSFCVWCFPGFNSNFCWNTQC